MLRSKAEIVKVGFWFPVLLEKQDPSCLETSQNQMATRRMEVPPVPPVPPVCPLKVTGGFFIDGKTDNSPVKRKTRFVRPKETGRRRREGHGGFEDFASVLACNDASH